jgi:hypothetical protein
LPYILWALIVIIREDSGLDIKIEHFENSREDPEEYYYKTDGNNLRKLAYLSTEDIESEPRSITQDLVEYESGIKANRFALISDIGGREQ